MGWGGAGEKWNEGRCGCLGGGNQVGDLQLDRRDRLVEGSMMDILVGFGKI